MNEARGNDIRFGGLCLVSIFALAGCATPEVDAGGGLIEDSSIVIAQTQPFYSYNDENSTGQAGANQIILYLTRGAFNYSDPAGEVMPDTSYGSYEVLSEEPLSVKYTIDEDATWSDGAAVDAADLLLQWAAMSTNVNEGDVFFDASSVGLALVGEVPEVGDDGRSITMTYDEPYADWETLFTRVTLPAHIVAEKALGIEDPDEAKETVISAIQDGSADLADLAEFWNTGYAFTSLPDDPDLLVSSGAYIIEDFVEDEYMTLVANDAYTGELSASIERITVRYNADAMAQVQALENGEVNLINPQSSTDVLTALESISGIESQTSTEITFELMPITFNGEGPFSAAHWGGDEETAELVRKAFMKVIPRQGIVEALIQPLDENATTRDSYSVASSNPHYEDVTSASSVADEYAEVDVEGALALLEQAGVTAPIDVRFMYYGSNVRRANTVSLVQESAALAGFNVIADGDDDMGNRLGDGSYDVVIYGTSTKTPAVSANMFMTDQGANYSKFSSEIVDELYGELIVTSDEATQYELLAQIEAELTEVGWGLPLYQWPGVVAWSDGYSGFDGSSPFLVWNYWEWQYDGE